MNSDSCLLSAWLVLGQARGEREGEAPLSAQPPFLCLGSRLRAAGDLGWSQARNCLLHKCFPLPTRARLIFGPWVLEGQPGQPDASSEH